MSKITLEEVTKDELIDGYEYLTKMKHGWISGIYIAEDNTFAGYYWRDMEWYGHNYFELPENTYEKAAV